MTNMSLDGDDSLVLGGQISPTQNMVNFECMIHLDCWATFINIYIFWLDIISWKSQVIFINFLSIFSNLPPWPVQGFLSVSVCF